MKNTIKYMLVAGFLASAPAAFADEVDCQKLYTSVTQEVTGSSSKVLEIVEKYISENPECACEVVKAAIVASEADKGLVAEIVTTATLASPDKLRLVAQCAIAVAPDALAEVQQVMAKYDRQGGESVNLTSSAKGGYDEKAAAGGVQNPASGNNNPLNGPSGSEGLGSFPLLPVGDAPIHPEFPDDLTPISPTAL